MEGEPERTGAGNTLPKISTRTSGIIDGSIFRFARAFGRSVDLTRKVSMKATCGLITVPALIVKSPIALLSLLASRNNPSADVSDAVDKPATPTIKDTSPPAEGDRPVSEETIEDNNAPQVLTGQVEDVTAETPSGHRVEAGTPTGFEDIFEAAEFNTKADRDFFVHLARDISGENLKTRITAIKRLSSIPNQATVELLSRLLGDANGMVRVACLNSLMEISDRSAIPFFEERLKDANMQVRLAAVRGLYNLGGTNSIPAIRTALKDRHPLVRRRAAICLGWSGSEMVVQELSNLFNDPDDTVRRAAIEAHAAIKSEKSVSLLISSLSDKDADLRNTANSALEKIAGMSVDFDASSSRDERMEAINKWKAWEKTQDSSDVSNAGAKTAP